MQNYLAIINLLLTLLLMYPFLLLVCTLPDSQVLPRSYLRNSHPVELLYENVKYNVLVTRKAPQAFVLTLNEYVRTV